MWATKNSLYAETKPIGEWLPSSTKVGATRNKKEDEMRKLRLLLIIPLLATIFLCPLVASAEDGLDVDIVVTGDEPDVDVDVLGDDADVNVNVDGDNPSVNINGQDIDQPTVIHSTTVIDSSSGCCGLSYSDVCRTIDKRLKPLYAWMKDRDGAIGLTMDGLAKVIITIGDVSSNPGTIGDALEEQSSRLDEQALRLDEQGEGIDALTGRATNLESYSAYLESELAYSQRYVEYLRDTYNNNLMILFGLVGALVITNIIVVVKLRKKI